MCRDAPHRIRLRNQWILQPVRATIETLPQRVQTGRSWQEFLGNFAGSVLYQRSFNRPTGLESSRVHLCFSDLTGNAIIRFNGEVLDNSVTVPARYDITEQLRTRNHIEIEIGHPNGTGGITGEIYLEISST